MFSLIFNPIDPCFSLILDLFDPSFSQNLVCSGLAYEIYSGGGTSTYVYCVVCYRVIVAPYVRSVGHVFAYLYTLDNDSERPMDYMRLLYSLQFFLYWVY